MRIPAGTGNEFPLEQIVSDPLHPRRNSSLPGRKKSGGIISAGNIDNHPAGNTLPLENGRKGFDAPDLPQLQSRILRTNAAIRKDFIKILEIYRRNSKESS